MYKFQEIIYLLTFYSSFWPVCFCSLLSDVIVNVSDIDTRRDLLENSTVAINGTVTGNNYFTYQFVSHQLSYQYRLIEDVTYGTVTKQLIIRTREFMAISLCISQTG